ncbi:hypothetical protein HNQ07_003184 [Deinococcus metalli]|uniref:EF-hand domain-containing protein n=1 Tax=Deinococcus metalli TaxID=1141878 RepID=A0A7W8KGV7_9DEIO|nr:hypothetical protein [Deinococcus metalli]MBB5377685.1 hypothetical protein [Deinococcus metalli]GHF52545.1 hypothetical protein GCM10017781_31130 [Deinococcus metalli]
MKRLRTALTGTLLVAALLGAAQAATVKLRPQGDVLTKAVQEALAALSTKELPVTLDTSAGPLLFLGGSGTSSAPFNPDVAARVVTVGTERRIEFNPQGPLPLADAVKAELTKELGLSAWTQDAARARLSGADLNGDGKITLADLAILMGNYGKTGALPGDLNQDQRVDDADLKLFSTQYTLSVPAAAPATTPATPPSTGTGTAPATAPATTTPATTPPTSSPPPASKP